VLGCISEAGQYVSAYISVSLLLYVDAMYAYLIRLQDMYLLWPLGSRERGGLPLFFSFFLGGGGLGHFFGGLENGI